MCFVAKRCSPQHFYPPVYAYCSLAVGDDNALRKILFLRRIGNRAKFDYKVGHRFSESLELSQML